MFKIFSVKEDTGGQLICNKALVVKQGEEKRLSTSSNTPFYTHGLASCIGLLIKNNARKVFMHIDNINWDKLIETTTWIGDNAEYTFVVNRYSIQQEFVDIINYPASPNFTEQLKTVSNLQDYFENFMPTVTNKSLIDNLKEIHDEDPEYLDDLFSQNIKIRNIVTHFKIEKYSIVNIAPEIDVLIHPDGRIEPVCAEPGSEEEKDDEKSDTVSLSL